MAVTSSGGYYITFRDALQNDIALDLTADTLKIALYTNSITPNFDTDTAYSATNEVSGTGYSAGGAALSGAAISVVSHNLTFDATDSSWSTSTITNARAGIIYDTTVTSPTNKPLVCLINFGGDYSTTSGTFTVQYSASGIFQISGM